jgi:hypothetical protein
MRINRHLYASTAHWLLSADLYHPSGPPPERRALARQAEQPESEIDRDLWSIWIDLGGEG